MVDTYPEEGDYLVTVTARAELPEGPLMEVSVGYRPDTEQSGKSLTPLKLRNLSRRLMSLQGVWKIIPYRFVARGSSLDW